ncbi:MAG: RNA-binding transcriptional accessory protein [Prevotella sp.]|nr:RNA-binding transcriptional accessory protein [Prevotella sp.]MBQ6054357.1 RNA-binding transcriptional accessory protein [Prevotella sp.]MBQ6917281.1 RNA-binding transcriptional accessory protein [Prevotella sp.]
MQKNVFSCQIATQLGISQKFVEATLALLDEGCTIPFIARYRKERTGGLDEVQIAAISDRYEKLLDIQKRKETVIKTITDLDKMTPELQERINQCWDATEIEDIYLPYKPKRRTRAQVAREQGLEPLALLLMKQRERDPEAAAAKFAKGDVDSVESAIKGAQDIIAEVVSENEKSRQQLRNAFTRQAVITSKVVKAKANSDEAAKYSDYFDWSEPLKRCSSHRLLAMRRGESEGILRISISPNDDEALERLKHHYVYGNTPCGRLVAEAIDDGYKRLLKPAIETEFAAQSKEKADEEAIHVFAENLRQLLLGAPLGQKRVLGIDPGFRTGCKVVCLDAQGNLLHHDVIMPHPPVNKRTEAAITLQRLIQKFQIEAISIGNGTASRETDSFVKDVLAGKYNVAADSKSSKAKADDKNAPTPQVFVVSEAGASVYSASKVARDEFPNEDVTVRGAVSIGRRLMDPLAELVKIDPKSIGVGQYQHDVDQTKLKHSLDQTVESCVNLVGVDLNTASQHLLMYVSGLGATLAKNIIDYRREHGAFTSRAQLLKVPRLGPSAYQQCAGFLRIHNAKNPLDGTAVHPESYPIVQQMAKDQGCTVADLIHNKEKREALELPHYVTADVGMPTLTDIMAELEKPGRDPRQQLEAFEFDKNVSTIDDLVEGMVLPGIVTNITNFGAFVDIGVHHDGLVHISQMANRRIAHPLDVVKLHQHVQVRVTEVDHRRQRISLSMKGL